LAVNFTDVNDRIELCGLTQKEASQYLKDHGFNASVGAMASWGRGHYKPPEGVMETLDSLLAVIERTDSLVDEKGIPLPAGALARRKQRRKIKPIDFSRLKALLGDRDPEDDDIHGPGD
jgi:hypothetical protein